MSGLVLPGDARIGVKPVRYKDLILSTGGLVSAWPLDELSGTNADDAKSTSDGTYTGGYTLGQPGAVRGYTATEVNGSTGHVAIPHAAALAPTAELSLEAWAKPDLNTADLNQRVIDKSNTVLADPFSDYALTTNAASAKAGCELTIGGVYKGTYSDAALTAGLFYHLAGTYDGTTMKLYVNGALQAGSTAASGAIAARGMPVYIGRYGADAGIVRFDGTAGWVAIYNRALTADEIRMHYVAGLRKRQLGLVA